MVCHGGSGTTFSALAARVPLVVVPMFADQPGNARLAAAAGAGLVAELSAGAVRTALLRILAEDGFGRAAARLATGMAAVPDVDALVTGPTAMNGLTRLNGLTGRR